MAYQDTFQLDRRPAFVPLWRESLTAVDWFRLRLSPTYFGVDLPRGDGSAVIVVPGFLGSDGYLAEMRWWLQRLGYRAYRSQIGQNADCLDVLADRLLETVERATTETGRPAHLIGHSLGGLLARGVARRAPASVASLVTMGSPIRGIRSHPLVLRAGDAVGSRVRAAQRDQGRPRCLTGLCECEMVRAMLAGVPDEVPEIAIFTRTDGVVAWRFCVHSDPTKNIEVTGTHCGLAFNPQAYRAVANFLAG